MEAVVGLEARGFLFSFSLAAELSIGCIPVRKKGKLPGDIVSHSYDLEYGSVSILYIYIYIASSIQSFPRLCHMEGKYHKYRR